jgi:hypothetical protein
MKSIILKSWEVLAVLDGRKTQKRFVVKPQPSESFRLLGIGIYNPTIVDRHGEQIPGPETFGTWSEEEDCPCPYQPGETRFAKESFIPKASGTIYRADFDPVEAAGLGGMYGGWKSAVHMPEHLSRIRLEIVAVRCQRLREITDSDALKEGCCGVARTTWGTPNFRFVWDSQHSKHGHCWAENPWVWAVTWKLDTAARKT